MYPRISDNGVRSSWLTVATNPSRSSSSARTALMSRRIAVARALACGSPASDDARATVEYPPATRIDAPSGPRTAVSR